MSTVTETSVAVEVWSDLACPYCYIGKRHFEAALARFAGREGVTVRWRSFQLAPDMPVRVEGGLPAYLSEKFGVSQDEARAMNERVSAMAAAAGLAYDLERARPGNTRDAHRVLQLAADRDLQEAVLERLFAAYFCEGERLSDHETLLRLGAEAGLDRGELTALLDGDAYATAVDADIQAAGALGLSAVPAFVFDRTFGVTGAHPPEQLLMALERAAEAHGEPPAA